MPSSDERDHRLHPISLLFTIGAQARAFLLPGIVVLLVASRGDFGQAWIMLAFFPALIGALFHYVSYRYRFGEEEIVVREGIFFRNERHIPYARVQNVDTVQNPFHRLFKVAEVRVETAGGQKPEAVMRVLSLDAIERMRARVVAGRAELALDEGAAAAVTADRSREAHQLLRMHGWDVVLFGLISNKGMVVVAAAFGAFWQLDVADSWFKSITNETWSGLRSQVPGNGLGWVYTAAALAALLLLLVLLMRVLSVVWAVAKFFGFRLTENGEDLRAEFGLFPHVSKTIPRHRIQVLSTRAGFLHRRCGRTAVQVETAGGATEDGGVGADRIWLAPLIRTEHVARLIREAVPEVDIENLSWQSISPRARWRRLRLWITLGTIAATGLLFVIGPWSLLLLPLAAMTGWIQGRLLVAYTKYAISPGAIYFKSGWWNRQMSVTRFSKIQAVASSASPFDRRNRMASVSIDTAGATRIGHGVDIPYLDQAVAASLAGRLYGEAVRTDFHW